VSGASRRQDQAVSAHTSVSGLCAPLSSQLREIGLGHNPKVPTFRGERGYHGANHAGAVHWGFGGGHQKKRIHVDAIIFQSTINANGTVIVDRGRLKALDDADVRQLAGKYGDPDRVLSEAL